MLSSGIAFRQYSDYFKMLKNTSVAVMKKFGFGERATMEVKINKEVKMLVTNIHEMNGKAFDIEQMQRLSILNIMYSLIFGKRFKSDDPIGEYISAEILAMTKSFHPIFDLFPLVRFIPKFRQMLKDLVPRGKQLHRTLQDKAEKCQIDPSGDENFVTEFIKQAGSSLDKTDIPFIIRDLLGAGMETSSTLILWAFVLICNHPSIQQRLHKEIDSVVPRERLPSLTDKLPYLEATILEIMRLKSLLPLSIPHVTICDTEVGGFFIPANTQVNT